jgi:threonyl-tRNA synthetase
MSRDEAVATFKKLGEHYKAEIIGSIPADQDISLYGQGDWFDLCRGPHVPSTGRLGAFKLMKVAGAYWRGDSRNEMLQRIYGTAWPDEKQLKAYLTRLEEPRSATTAASARSRISFISRRRLRVRCSGIRKGWTLFQALIGYMRERQNAVGYQEVSAPEIMDAALWAQSGHLEKFGENMYTTKTPG